MTPIEAYQKMADLKPCLQAYTRIAHVRWLKGDLEGAIEVAEEAAGTGTARPGAARLGADQARLLPVESGETCPRRDRGR